MKHKPEDCYALMLLRLIFGLQRDSDNPKRIHAPQTWTAHEHSMSSLVLAFHSDRWILYSLYGYLLRLMKRTTLSALAKSCNWCEQLTKAQRFTSAWKKVLLRTILQHKNYFQTTCEFLVIDPQGALSLRRKHPSTLQQGHDEANIAFRNVVPNSIDDDSEAMKRSKSRLCVLNTIKQQVVMASLLNHLGPDIMSW